MFGRREASLVCMPRWPGRSDRIDPHPASGNMREEFHRDEVEIVGQVVGVLYPAR
jgi:hypothetical protein